MADINETKSYTGGCFCGAVQVRVTGAPVAAGYCHCESCRRWSASPVNAFTLWKPEQVEVAKGGDRLAGYSRTERSYRRWCATCGGHVFTEHPTWGVIDVYAAVIPGFPFQAGVHVNYAETVLPVNKTDSLPKQRDYPSETGGSGVLMAA